MPSILEARCSNRHSGPPLQAAMIHGTNVNIEYANLEMQNFQVIEATLESRYGADFALGFYAYTHLTMPLLSSSRPASFQFFSRRPSGHE